MPCEAVRKTSVQELWQNICLDENLEDVTSRQYFELDGTPLIQALCHRAGLAPSAERAPSHQAHPRTEVSLPWPLPTPESGPGHPDAPRGPAPAAHVHRSAHLWKEQPGQLNPCGRTQPHTLHIPRQVLPAPGLPATILTFKGRCENETTFPASSA